jgi:alkaline phosphatase D
VLQVVSAGLTVKRLWGVVLFAVLLTFAGSSIAAEPAAPGMPVFTHGVASGDVTSIRAVLWTRVDREATVKVEVFDSPSFTDENKAFEKTLRVTNDDDFTAKVRANGLEPATTYFYRWRHGEIFSPVGTFRTAPAPATAADVEFAYSGDSDGTRFEGAPFFNNFEVLDAIRSEGPDFFSYLGDTIYSDSVLRSTGPATTLPEYRDAYKVNRLIAALPGLLKATSTYPQWDDHEVLDDYDGQTVSASRYARGREAFLEYMPLDDSALPDDPTCAGDPMFRAFHWGSEVDIFIPDERSCRSGSVEVVCQGDLAPTLPETFRVALRLPAEPPAGCLDAINEPSRTMLGPVQKSAFKQALLGSKAKFKFVLSELAFQQFYALPYDRWEGYAAERVEILDFIRDNGIKNVVFLTTDNHANIVNQVFIDALALNPVPIATELITGPIATFTLKEEILRLFGPVEGPAQLAAFNQVLTLVGVDCRALDTYSYGHVAVDASAGTATVTLKDETGATIQDALTGDSCTETFGP